MHRGTKGTGVAEFPVIAGKKIYRRGDVVALVAADTEEHARAAAKKVKQNLEVLPTYLTFPEAVMPNAIQIHEGIPNCLPGAARLQGRGHRRALRRRARSSPRAASTPSTNRTCPSSPTRCRRYWGTDGMLTIQCKCQNLSEKPAKPSPTPAASPKTSCAW